MHVSTTLKDRAFVLLFNPTAEPISRILQLPLYYTGLKGKVSILQYDGKLNQQQLTVEQKLGMKVNIPANGYAWYVIREMN
jgi:hypothetical protein